MKTKLFTIIFLITLFACSNSEKKSTNNKSVDSEKVVTDNGKTIADSTKSIKEVGIEILGGAPIFGNNEKYLFQLMDSLIVKNSNERAFYFKVFKKIVEKSDGYVSEAIGLYALKYLENYPNEFFSLSDEEIKSFMGYIAYEVRLSENNADSSLRTLLSQLKEKSNKETTKKIDLFEQELNENLNENK